jgi:membrane protease YdiL (CAAX protease family)
MRQQQGEAHETTLQASAEEGAVASDPTAGIVAITALGISVFAAGSLLFGRGRNLLREQPREPAGWSAADVAAVILLHIACQMVAQGLLLPQPMPEGVVVWQQLAAGALASLLTLAIALPVLVSRTRNWRPLRFTSRQPVRDIAAGLLMLLAITPALLLTAGMLNRLVPYHHPILDFLAAQRDPAALALTAVSAVIVAPLAEEFFFRGMLQGWLERVAPAAAVPVSAVAFGLAHTGHGLGWIPLIGFGAAAGILARQTGSLLASIVLHASFNAIGLTAALAQLPAPGR